MKDVRSMVYCSMFAVLIAVGAFIKIPVSIVPITMQTLFVVMAGLLLGRKKAFLAVLIYIIIGLIGLPIFANGGGIAYVLQPTFGYLIGFLVVAYCIGFLSEKRRDFISMLVISIVGMLIIYIIGMLYFAFVQNLYYGLTFKMSWILYYLFLVYVPGDILSCIVGVLISRRLLKVESIRQIRN